MHDLRIFAAASFALLSGTITHATAASFAPPETWQEHWFEHKETVKRVSFNDDVAVYFDPKVSPDGAQWITPFMTKVWQYTKKTYGDFGPDARLYCIFHQGNYSGGHPSTYFDGSHDFRNVSDVGPGPFNTPQYDIPSHEVGHIVEGASGRVHGSPAFGIWKDSKWAEFYQYDLYLALGMKQDAQRLFDKFSATTDDFPKPGTHWFRDWFFPLWRDYGHAKVMVNFFALLAKHFPKEPDNNGKNQKFKGGLNWGEYIHFTSGAAGADLRPLATKAFGWPPDWDAQYNKARKDFPAIRYAPAANPPKL